MNYGHYIPIFDNLSVELEMALNVMGFETFIERMQETGVGEIFDAFLYPISNHSPGILEDLFQFNGIYYILLDAPKSRNLRDYFFKCDRSWHQLVFEGHCPLKWKTIPRLIINEEGLYELTVK